MPNTANYSKSCYDLSQIAFWFCFCRVTFITLGKYIVWSPTWSGAARIAPWPGMLGLLGIRPIPGFCCWLPVDTCLGKDGVCVCCDTTMFCCLVAGFQAGRPWVWTGGVGVLPILCWPGDVLCTACWAEGCELEVLGCWDAGESVRLLTGRGLDLLFNPART